MARKKKIPEDMMVGTVHNTKKSGNIEILSYLNSKEVTVVFLATGEERLTTQQSIRKGTMRSKQPIDMVKGTIHKTTLWGDLLVTEYISQYKVKVMFINSGNERVTSSSNVRLGLISDRCTKVAGMGINDSETNVKRKEWNGTKFVQTWSCPFYIKWAGIIQRCYEEQSDGSCYKNVSVCDEWLYFSNFRSWMKAQDWEGKTVDKDLLQKGVEFKVYSPDTCLMVSRGVNNFLLENTVDRTQFELGVSLRDDMVSYTVNCSNPFTDSKTSSLGCYATEAIASSVYKRTKYKYMLKLLDTVEDIRVRCALEDYYSDYKEFYYEN